MQEWPIEQSQLYLHLSSLNQQIQKPFINNALKNLINKSQEIKTQIETAKPDQDLIRKFIDQLLLQKDDLLYWY